MSELDLTKYSKFFEYNPLTEEITILQVNEGKGAIDDIVFDSENNLMWVKDDVTTFNFKDGKIIKTATADRGDWVVFSLAESKIKDFVMRKLGYPVVRLELTLRQLKDSIDETVEEMAPWVVQPTYVTVNANSPIDLSEYNVSYVINVSPADGISSNAGSNGAVDDIFSVGYTTVSGGYARYGYREAFYSQLEMNLSKKVQGTTTGGLSWKWIEAKNELLVDVGSTNASKVTVEYSPRIRSVDDLTEDIYLSLAKKFALAFTRATLSDIRGKFKVDGSPVELDASEQNDKSNTELERLRQEMKDTVSTHYPVD